MAASASKAMQELESYEREVRQCIQDLDTQVYKLEHDHLAHTAGSDDRDDEHDDDMLAGLMGLQMGATDDQFGTAGLAPSGGVGDDDDDDDAYDDPDFDASRGAASSQGLGDGGSDGEDGDGGAGSRRSGRKRTRKAFGEE